MSTIFGGKTGTSSNESRTNQTSENIGMHLDRAEADGKSNSNAIQTQKAKADGINFSKTIGTSIQITRTNKKAQRYVDILDRQIERLQNGMPLVYGLSVHILSRKIRLLQKNWLIYTKAV